jgi:predicted phage-related endonuclease
LKTNKIQQKIFKNQISILQDELTEAQNQIQAKSQENAYLKEQEMTMIPIKNSQIESLKLKLQHNDFQAKSAEKNLENAEKNN